MGTQILTTYTFPIIPPTYTHTVKKLQISRMWPQWDGSKWLQHCWGVWEFGECQGEMGWASMGSQSWSLASPNAPFVLSLVKQIIFTNSFFGGTHDLNLLNLAFWSVPLRHNLKIPRFTPKVSVVRKCLRTLSHQTGFRAEHPARRGSISSCKDCNIAW